MFQLFEGSFRKNPPHVLPFYPSNLLFTKHMDHILTRFLVDFFAVLWSSWNTDSKCSSQKVESQTCKRHFLIHFFSWPSPPPKTEIYPSKRDKLDHILTLSRFHSTRKAVFRVLKIPCVLNFFPKPRPQKNSLATGVTHKSIYAYLPLIMSSWNM